MEIKDVLEKLNAEYQSSQKMILKENGVEFTLTVSELKTFFLIVASVPLVFKGEEDRKKVISYLESNNDLLSENMNNSLDIGLYSLMKRDGEYYLDLKTSIWVDKRVTVPKMQELFRQMQARLFCTLNAISYDACKQA